MRSQSIRAVFLVAVVTVIVWAAEAGAQSILLQIRPKAGDTLHVRLDQHVELSRSESPADSGFAMTTGLIVLTRALVQRVDAAGALVLAMIDSVIVKESGLAQNSASAERTRASLQRQRVTMRVAPDGGAEVIDGVGANEELRALFAEMPPTLPRKAVAVGEKWVRVMAIPRGGADRQRRGGSVRATFRLDSVAADGVLAYISMSGTLSHDAGPTEELPRAMTQDMYGTVTGTIVLDRRRGWITDSKTQMIVRSRVAAPAGSKSKPMNVRMKITQRMRTLR